jgi:hypothetical protein
MNMYLYIGSKAKRSVEIRCREGEGWKGINFKKCQKMSRFGSR